MIQAFPLCWPQGYQRTSQRKHARFRITLGRARDEVKDEIRRIGGKNPVISTNIPTKINGDLYASYKSPEDTGVAVYFTYKDSQVCLCADQYILIEDNLKAISRTIAALRQIDRDGVSDFLNRTFTGFKELPAGEQKQKRSCWDVLGIQPTTHWNAINQAYMSKVKDCHPDLGGSHEAFIELTDAVQEANRLAKQ